MEQSFFYEAGTPDPNFKRIEWCTEYFCEDCALDRDRAEPWRGQVSQPWNKTSAWPGEADKVTWPNIPYEGCYCCTRLVPTKMVTLRILLVEIRGAVQAECRKQSRSSATSVTAA